MVVECCKDGLQMVARGLLFVGVIFAICIVVLCGASGLVICKFIMDVGMLFV